MEMHNRGSMTKRYFLLLWLFALPFSGGGGAVAQNDASRIRVSVVLVQLSVAVTDRKGNYVSGLRPEDFTIVEDKIPEKIATFEEGNEPTRRLIDPSPSNNNRSMMSAAEAATEAASAAGNATIASPQVTGSNVFILFDTSNYMYRG